MALWSRRSASAWQPFASASRSLERAAAVCLAGLVLTGLAITADARAISGLARVDDDGHLVVAGERIALAGIEVPTFGRVCRRTASPVRCGPPAVLVLDELVRGFVRCEIVSTRGPYLLEGRCTIAARRLLDDRLDLAAELLRRGWAFALDDAPGLYRSLERLARTRESGIWADAAVDWR
jgi:endonuclease YncB( thermonuclease family)